MRLIIFCLFLPCICFSQQTINATQFFDNGLAGFVQAEKTTGKKVNFPWIDQYELRTETRDFDLGKQEYTLRVSPSSGKIRKAQKAFYEELINAPDFDAQEIFCDLALVLQDDWLSLFILNENQSVMDELVVILKDKQTIYERMMGTYEFNPQKLLRLQTEKSDLEITLNEIKLEKDFLLNKYGIEGQEIDFGDFATVESISEYLANNVLSQNQSTITDVEVEYKKQLLLKEMELESSEEKRLIDFAQIKYTGPHDDLIQERISIGMGIQFSNSGNTKLKMQELKLQQEELERESERDIQKIQTRSVAFENKLQRDIQTYFLFQKTMQEEKTQLEEMSSKISQKEGTSPLFLLEIKERHLFMKAKSLNKKEDLLRDYLKYLHQSGKMCESATFTNYLIP